MALIDVIKHENHDDGWFAWKHPSTNIVWGGQLVVGEGQQAVFVKGGQVCDTLLPGTHTLSTGNIPILQKIINLPFGGDTPFTAEIWFINTTVKRDLKWGTPSPIQLFDQHLGFPVSARAFGKWGVRIHDSISFLRQLVGTQSLGDSERVRDYFIGHLIENLVAQVARDISTGEASILNISAALNSISERAFEKLSLELKKFGVELINFNVESISIPDEEMQRIQDVFAKTFEARELSKVNTGGAFAQIKSFEIMQSAAENPSENTVGAMLGAGIGLGAGFPIGGQVAQQVNLANDSQQSTDLSVADKLRALKALYEDGLISEEQFKVKQLQLLEDL